MRYSSLKVLTAKNKKGFNILFFLLEKSWKIESGIFEIGKLGIWHWKFEIRKFKIGKFEIEKSEIGKFEIANFVIGKFEIEKIAIEKF